MKRIIALIMALTMATVLMIMPVAAEESKTAAETVPEEYQQPEGGLKFEGNWAIMDGLVEIVYEEEGYRVYIELYNQDNMSGEIWEYACYYNEEKDVLESVTSRKHTYSTDPETYEVNDNEAEYEGFDEEGQMTVFAIDENGRLTWADGRENAGADLEFQPIGEFQGIWRNEEENVYVEIDWRGLTDEETFFYYVFIRRGAEEQYTEFSMTGLYNPDTDKLECSGSATSFTRNAEGGFDAAEDGETYDAFFSDMGNGRLLFETENGIELEYFDPAMENG